jgi:ParB family chromosome partitioning protein
MQIPVEEIVIKRRIRQDLGDISKLMESLKAYALMNPILINSSRELIAGRRRLEAAKRLGWKKLEMEIDENLLRRNLSAVELAEGMSRLEKLKNPGFFRKILNAISRFFRRVFGRRK